MLTSMYLHRLHWRVRDRRRPSFREDRRTAERSSEQIETWVNLLMPARSFGFIILVSFCPAIRVNTC
ncbi:hypothetical protein EIP86_003260 [Pleurotus ostreatoroseus]|nr:hypothetical protein EIP86_003260 [Pleurotus ostreatoroseus]